MGVLGQTQEGPGVGHLSASFFLSFPQSQTLGQGERIPPHFLSVTINFKHHMELFFCSKFYFSIEFLLVSMSKINKAFILL